MGKEPIMFRSREKRKFNWRILAIFAAFFLLAGAVKIFGLQNITGFMSAESDWTEDETIEPIEAEYTNTWQNYTPYEYTSNYSYTPYKRQPKVYGGGSSGMAGSTPGIKPIEKQPLPPNPLFENGTWATVGVYYNRTMPRSDSYQIVPVPGATLETTPSIENYTPTKTNASGLSTVFNPNETTITILAPGFLANKHARKIINNETKAVHFFLTISKSKVSMQSHDRFVMGKISNTTFSISTMLPDTVLPDHKEVLNTLVDVVLIKEVNEKIYELSEHFQKKVNLIEGTQQVSIPVSVASSMNARDLYLPKLWVKLLTSTSDIIHNKKEKISIGFLEAGLNNTTITITNPTGKKIESILLSSEILNKKQGQLNLSFSENNFNLDAKTTKNITIKTSSGQGVYSGAITITGTLPPSGDWDDPASDAVFLKFSKSFPIHDVSIKARATPLLSGDETELETLLENKGNFSENITILLKSDNFSITDQTTLQSGVSKKHLLSFNTSNLSKGLASFMLSASIENDFNPADNFHNLSFYISKNSSLQNIVLLFFDGMGALYLNEELTPNLVGLQYRGFTQENMDVRIPSTTQSHSTTFTSQHKKDYDWRAFAHSVSLPNNTIFDSARSSNYTVLGVMGQGDSAEVVEKMDAILHDPYNNWDVLNSTLTINANISQNLRNVFKASNNLSSYQNRTSSVYVDYDQWTADSITSILQELSQENQSFLLVSNFAGTDHGGHSGPSDYTETLAAADLQTEQILNTLLKTGLIENTILIITADHGMCFREGSYGEYGYHASCSKPEAKRIPFIVVGPKIPAKLSNSLSYNDDIVPTLEHLFSIPKQEASTGRVLKEISENFTDVGIISITTTPLVPGSEANTTIILKNYNSSVETRTFCFNNSLSKTCTQVTLQPNKEKHHHFLWTPEDSGVYPISANLSENDDNQHNNIAKQTLHAGIVFDIGVGDAWYSITGNYYDNETRKISLDIEICNHGTLAFEDNVNMRIWTENCNDSWCNKTYNPKFSATSGNCNKYKSGAPFGLKTGLHTIHFQILNSSDMNLEDDYKTLTTHLTK